MFETILCDIIYRHDCDFSSVLSCEVLEVEKVDGFVTFTLH